MSENPQDPDDNTINSDVEILLTESRRSVDRKLDKLREIDEKAVRSVRVSLVVVGFLVASAGILNGNNSPSVSAASWAYASIGVFSLSVSTVAGVGTIAASDFKTSLSEEERKRVRDDFHSEDGIPAVVLTEINTEWGAILDEELRRNIGYLGVTLGTLLTGMLFLLAAGLLLTLQYLFTDTVGGMGFGTKLTLAFAGAVAVLLTSYLIIQRTKEEIR